MRDLDDLGPGSEVIDLLGDPLLARNGILQVAYEEISSLSSSSENINVNETAPQASSSSSTTRTSLSSSSMLFTEISRGIYQRLPLPITEWLPPSPFFSPTISLDNDKSSSLSRPLRKPPVAYILPSLQCAFDHSNEFKKIASEIPANWYRMPYCTLILVRCETLDEFLGTKTGLIGNNLGRNRSKNGGYDGEKNSIRARIIQRVNELIEKRSEFIVVYCPKGRSKKTSGSWMVDTANKWFGINNYDDDNHQDKNDNFDDNNGVVSNHGIGGKSLTQPLSFISPPETYHHHQQQQQQLTMSSSSLSDSTYSRIFEKIKTECVPNRFIDKVVRLDEGELHHQREYRDYIHKERMRKFQQLEQQQQQRQQHYSATSAAVSTLADDDYMSNNISSSPPLPLLPPSDPALDQLRSYQWAELMKRLHLACFDTLTDRIASYDRIASLSFNARYEPEWNFCNYLILKESLAFVYAQVRLPQEALSCYEEIENVFNLTSSISSSLVVSNTSSSSSSGHHMMPSTKSSSSSSSTSSLHQLGPSLSNVMRRVKGLSPLGMLESYPKALLSSLQAQAYEPPLHSTSTTTNNIKSTSSSTSSFSSTSWDPAMLTLSSPPLHILDLSHVPYRGLLYAGYISLFDLKKYIFARQSSLLSLLKRTNEQLQKSIDFLTLVSEMGELQVASGRLDINALRTFKFCAALDLAESCLRTRGSVTRHKLSSSSLSTTSSLVEGNNVKEEEGGGGEGDITNLSNSISSALSQNESSLSSSPLSQSQQQQQQAHVGSVVRSRAQSFALGLATNSHHSALDEEFQLEQAITKEDFEAIGGHVDSVMLSSSAAAAAAAEAAAIAEAEAAAEAAELEADGEYEMNDDASYLRENSSPKSLTMSDAVSIGVSSPPTPETENNSINYHNSSMNSAFVDTFQSPLRFRTGMGGSNSSVVSTAVVSKPKVLLRSEKRQDGGREEAPSSERGGVAAASTQSQYNKKEEANHIESERHFSRQLCHILNIATTSFSSLILSVSGVDVSSFTPLDWCEQTISLSSLSTMPSSSFSLNSNSGGPSTPLTQDQESDNTETSASFLDSQQPHQMISPSGGYNHRNTTTNKMMTIIKDVLPLPSAILSAIVTARLTETEKMNSTTSATSLNVNGKTFIDNKEINTQSSGKQSVSLHAHSAAGLALAHAIIDAREWKNKDIKSEYQEESSSSLSLLTTSSAITTSPLAILIYTSLLRMLSYYSVLAGRHRAAKCMSLLLDLQGVNGGVNPNHIEKEHGLLPHHSSSSPLPPPPSSSSTSNTSDLNREGQLLHTSWKTLSMLDLLFTIKRLRSTLLLCTSSLQGRKRLRGEIANTSHQLLSLLAASPYPQSIVESHLDLKEKEEECNLQKNNSNEKKIFPTRSSACSYAINSLHLVSSDMVKGNNNNNNNNSQAGDGGDTKPFVKSNRNESRSTLSSSFSASLPPPLIPPSLSMSSTSTSIMRTRNGERDTETQVKGLWKKVLNASASSSSSSSPPSSSSSSSLRALVLAAVSNAKGYTLPMRPFLTCAVSFQGPISSSSPLSFVQQKVIAGQSMHTTVYLANSLHSSIQISLIELELLVTSHQTNIMPKRKVQEGKEEDENVEESGDNSKIKRHSTMSSLSSSPSSYMMTSNHVSLPCAPSPFGTCLSTPSSSSLSSFSLPIGPQRNHLMMRTKKNKKKSTMHEKEEALMQNVPKSALVMQRNYHNGDANDESLALNRHEQLASYFTGSEAAHAKWIHANNEEGNSNSSSMRPILSQKLKLSSSSSSSSSSSPSSTSPHPITLPPMSVTPIVLETSVAPSFPGLFTITSVRVHLTRPSSSSSSSSSSPSSSSSISSSPTTTSGVVLVDTSPTIINGYTLENITRKINSIENRRRRGKLIDAIQQQQMDTNFSSLSATSKSEKALKRKTDANGYLVDDILYTASAASSQTHADYTHSSSSSSSSSFLHISHLSKLSHLWTSYFSGLRKRPQNEEGGGGERGEGFHSPPPFFIQMQQSSSSSLLSSKLSKTRLISSKDGDYKHHNHIDSERHRISRSRPTSVFSSLYSNFNHHQINADNAKKEKIPDDRYSTLNNHNDGVNSHDDIDNVTVDDDDNEILNPPSFLLPYLVVSERSCGIHASLLATSDFLQSIIRTGPSNHSLSQNSLSSSSSSTTRQLSSSSSFTPLLTGAPSWLIINVFPGPGSPNDGINGGDVSVTLTYDSSLLSLRRQSKGTNIDTYNDDYDADTQTPLIHVYIGFGDSTMTDDDIRVKDTDIEITEQFRKQEKRANAVSDKNTMDEKIISDSYVAVKVKSSHVSLGGSMKICLGVRPRTNHRRRRETSGHVKSPLIPSSLSTSSSPPSSSLSSLSFSHLFELDGQTTGTLDSKSPVFDYSAYKPPFLSSSLSQTKAPTPTSSTITHQQLLPPLSHVIKIGLTIKVHFNKTTSITSSLLKSPTHSSSSSSAASSVISDGGLFTLTDPHVHLPVHYSSSVSAYIVPPPKQNTSDKSLISRTTEEVPASAAISNSSSSLLRLSSSSSTSVQLSIPRSSESESEHSMPFQGSLASNLPSTFSSSSSSMYQVIVTKISPHDLLLGLGPVKPLEHQDYDKQEKHELPTSQSNLVYPTEMGTPSLSSSSSSGMAKIRRLFPSNHNQSFQDLKMENEEEENEDDGGNGGGLLSLSPSSFSSPQMIQLVIAVYIEKPLRLLRYSLSFPASSGWFIPTVGDDDNGEDINAWLIGKRMNPSERYFYPGSSSSNINNSGGGTTSSQSMSNISSSSSLFSPTHREKEPILVALAFRACRLVSASLCVTASLQCMFEIINDDVDDKYENKDDNDDIDSQAPDKGINKNQVNGGNIRNNYILEVEERNLLFFSKIE